MTPKPMPKAKSIRGKGTERAQQGTERANQGMPRAFVDRTRINAEDAGVAVQESKRPRLMRLGTPYAPRPPIVNINIFGSGGGSESASGSGGLLACNLFNFFLLANIFFNVFILDSLQMRYPGLCHSSPRFLARAWEASHQCPLQAPGQVDQCQPQGQCFRSCPMIVMRAMARARARPRAVQRTRAKTLSPRLAREKRFFPDQQQNDFLVASTVAQSGIVEFIFACRSLDLLAMGFSPGLRV